MAEDYGYSTSMVLGEGKKPSGEEVSFSLQSTALLLKRTKDRPTFFCVFAYLFIVATKSQPDAL
jgi:hypothetical protein